MSGFINSQKAVDKAGEIVRSVKVVVAIYRWLYGGGVIHILLVTTTRRGSDSSHTGTKTIPLSPILGRVALAGGIALVIIGSRAKK